MLKDISENRRTIILAAHREVVGALEKQGITADRASHAAVPATAKVASKMIGEEITTDIVEEVLGLD